MIKLERNFTPDFFTREDLHYLTQKFKDEGTEVWHHPDVKSACLKLSDNKCSFCEVKLEEASTYHEVEHFKDKNTFPDDVINWDNLLPSCRNCNGSKGRHNVVKNPIINPCNDLPSDHLYMRGYQIKGKTELGRVTVEVLNFNQLDHKFIPRCKAAYAIDDGIDSALDKLDWFIEKQNLRRRNILKNIVEIILLECQKDSSFSAVSATTLHSSDNYKKLKNSLQELGVWTDYMQYLHDKSLIIVLPLC